MIKNIEKYRITPPAEKVVKANQAIGEAQASLEANEYDLPEDYLSQPMYVVVCSDAKLCFPNDKNLQRLKIQAMLHIHSGGIVPDLTEAERAHYEEAKRKLYNS